MTEILDQLRAVLAFVSVERGERESLGGPPEYAGPVIAAEAALIDAIMTTTPQGGSPTANHVRTLFITSTMGPGIKLDIAQFRKG